MVSLPRITPRSVALSARARSAGDSSVKAGVATVSTEIRRSPGSSPAFWAASPGITAFTNTGTRSAMKPELLSRSTASAGIVTVTVSVRCGPRTTVMLRASSIL